MWPTQGVELSNHCRTWSSQVLFFCGYGKWCIAVLRFHFKSYLCVYKNKTFHALSNLPFVWRHLLHPAHSSSTITFIKCEYTTCWIWDSHIHAASVLFDAWRTGVVFDTSKQNTIIPVMLFMCSSFSNWVYSISVIHRSFPGKHRFNWSVIAMKSN